MICKLAVPVGSGARRQALHTSYRLSSDSRSARFASKQHEPPPSAPLNADDSYGPSRALFTLTVIVSVAASFIGRFKPSMLVVASA
jgi:hypothetical protein